MEKNNLNDAAIFKPVYSPKGFFIEYPKLNKKYVACIILRFLAFVFDLSFVIILWAILYFFIFKSNPYLPLIIPILYFMIYSTIVPMVTNGRTIGLFLTKMRIIHKSGFYTSAANYYFRGLCTSLYVIPVFGWFLMITSLISSFLTRGITITCLVSQTVVICDKTFKKLRMIEKEEQNEINIGRQGI